MYAWLSRFVFDHTALLTGEEFCFQLVGEAKGSFPELSQRFAEVDQLSCGGRVEDGECTDNAEPPRLRHAASFSFIDEDSVGFDFLGQGDGMRFARVELDGWVNILWGLLAEPGRFGLNPSLDLGQRVSVLEFSDHNRWDKDFPKEVRQDVDRINEDQVVERQCWRRRSLPRIGKVEAVKVLAQLFDGQQVLRDVVLLEDALGFEPGKTQYLREFQVGKFVLAVEFHRHGLLRRLVEVAEPVPEVSLQVGGNLKVDRHHCILRPPGDGLNCLVPQTPFASQAGG